MRDIARPKKYLAFSTQVMLAQVLSSQPIMNEKEPPC
ncbi:hypothetical protein Meth11DRAFT_2598 [Methylophilaceae bacterium 11]|nr:hypothetical protein Meth11DRAFT_2598 [Methylophilaceae bacterium 11]